LFLQSGVKIFVEKPLLNKISDLDDCLIDKNVLQNTDGVVGFDMRFFSLTSYLKELINSNKYGKAVCASLNVGLYLPFWHPYEDYRKSYAALSELGGGVLRTLCHEIDLAQYFFGVIEELYAQVDKLSSLEINSDDVVDIMLKCEKSRRVSVHLDYLKPNLTRNGEIQFEAGLLEYSYVKNTIYFTDYTTKKREKIFHTSETDNEVYEMQMKHFVNGIRDIACSFEDCEKSNLKGCKLCI
jgi:predicted dehydrogenase